MQGVKVGSVVVVFVFVYFINLASVVAMDGCGFFEFIISLKIKVIGVGFYLKFKEGLV